MLGNPGGSSLPIAPWWLGILDTTKNPLAPLHSHQLAITHTHTHTYLQKNPRIFIHLFLGKPPTFLAFHQSKKIPFQTPWTYPCLHPKMQEYERISESGFFFKGSGNMFQGIWNGIFLESCKVGPYQLYMGKKTPFIGVKQHQLYTNLLGHL